MRDENAPMSPRDAAERIRQLEGFDAALRRRTSGVTWMIWGIVAPAIFITYNLAAARGAPDAWMSALWIPWTAMGVAATFALWRSAGLVLRVDAGEARREGWVSVALFLAFVFGATLVTDAVDAALSPDAVVLGALGLVSLTMGVTGFAANDATERRLWLLVGALLLATATVASLLLADAQPLVAQRAFTVIGPVASAVAFFGAGAYLLAKG